MGKSAFQYPISAIRPYSTASLQIDEAAQATEPAILIPLATGAQRCVLVGDPQQLRPTTFSVATASSSISAAAAASAGNGGDNSGGGGGGGAGAVNSDALQRSLFERLENSGERVHLLDTQYRMHPGELLGEYNHHHLHRHSHNH